MARALRSASGDVWIGRFSEGALNGPGELLGADGSRYRGGFQFWRFHGQGLLEQLDGTRYEGGFAAGACAGQGTLDRADGSRERDSGPTASASATPPARPCPTPWKSACWPRVACSTKNCARSRPRRRPANSMP
ncbi:hypothetical protein P4133_26315 [Pseudomonas aeruginosa]|nr:hypothetical protein [Pseudomonas aeruginosa]